MNKAKTRQQVANELGISVSTLNRWIKKHKLQLPAGLLCEKYQKIIYDTFGAE